ncbi:hypothetical protein Tco_1099955, partial [Tanacetum coccineum]
MADTEVISMLDINVQHEVPRTSSLLTIPISVIPEHNVINPSETIINASATTISSLLSSLFPSLHQSTPILTRTTTEATTSTTAVPDSEPLAALQLRVTNLEKEVLKKHDADIIKELSVPLEHASKQQVPKSSITSSDTVALDEFDQKTTLFNTMTKSKSFKKSPKHIALYHALMESILEDEDAMDEGVAKKLKKRKPDDDDKDEGPSAGSDRGLKRQRKSKGTVTLKKTSSTKDSSKGKSQATSSKSSKSGKSAKDQVEELIFMQDFDYVKHDDADMTMDQGENLGKTDEQPNDEVVPKNDWYKNSRSDTSPDPKWNKSKLVDDGPEQSWLNDMAKATKPPLTFDELMHTLIDFSAFVINHLKIDNLIKEILIGPAYNLLKGTCKSYVELDYTTEECYHALSEQLDKNNPEGHHCPYDLTKPLHVNEWCGYGHLEEIVIKRADQQLYTFKEGDFKRLHLNDIEDMLLLIIQNKLNNLNGNVIVHLVVSLRIPAYTTLSNPQGVIYEENLKQKRFMHADELHKFSDGTLILVQDTLIQMLHELHLGYNKTIRRSQNQRDPSRDILLDRIEVL